MFDCTTDKAMAGDMDGLEVRSQANGLEFGMSVGDGKSGVSANLEYLKHSGLLKNFPLASRSARPASSLAL